MGLDKRKWIKDHWPTILREIAYHKAHGEAQERPFVKIWPDEENDDN